MTGDLVPLGETGWQVWRSAMLRGPGFPAHGLDLLAAPNCAQVADAHLAAAVDRAEFGTAFDAASAKLSVWLCDIAADPLFREAITWQNAGVLHQLDWLARTGPGGPRNSRRRQVEVVLTRYWQRYCGKNDTIGFFGPVCWIEFDPDGPVAGARPGPGLVRDRVVDLEWRALTTFADGLAADPRYRPWLPVRRAPHLALDGPLLLRPGGKPQRLPTATADLLALCDGTRTAREIARSSGLRKETDAYLLLGQLQEQGMVHWGISLPLSIAAEYHLREHLAAIGDPALRAEADAAFGRLSTARDELAAAAGDPAAVHTAMQRLEQVFVELTGGTAKHRPGATYAGRGVAYEDTDRDLDVRLGGPVLATLAPALDPLLRTARWLTAELARVCAEAMRELYEEAVASAGSPDVPFGELWVLARGMLLGDGPARAMLAEFTRHWTGLLLGGAEPGARDVRLDSAELARAVTAMFPAAGPGWPAARLHSPDIQLCAESVEALARGEFTAVLGELHVAWVTCDGGEFTRFHPDPDTLRAALRRDLGDRVLLLYPTDFPELTARLVSILDNEADVRLAYTDAPTPTLTGVLPLAALTASLVDGELVARAPDGRAWPALELLGHQLSELAVNAFRDTGSGPHTPRISVDNLVVQRETWRTTVGASGLAGPDGEADRYLAARRWRAELGLPERIYLRVGTEIKPCYADLTSPASVATMIAMVRAAHRAGGDSVPLTVSEALPTPEQAWLPDAAGRRYFSELRMTVRDHASSDTRAAGRATAARNSRS